VPDLARSNRDGTIVDRFGAKVALPPLQKNTNEPCVGHGATHEAVTNGDRIGVARSTPPFCRKPMKISFSFIAAISICLGCESTDHKADPQPYKNFESAIEAIATSDDIWVASAAAGQIYSGGVPAIEALRGYLDDDRVIPSGLCSRSINSNDVTLGEQSFWTIQDMIEETRVPLVKKSYYVLTRDNVEDWLDRQQGKSLVGLKIEAASASLGLANLDYQANNTPDARDAIEEYSELLVELHHAASEEYSKSLAKLRGTN
jgi:hypothetical protein